MVLDITVVLLALLLMVLGCIRGFVKEALGIAGLVAVVLFTISHGDYFSEMYGARVRSETLAEVFSRVTVFIGSMACVILVNGIIIRILSPLRHSLLDRVSGSILGMAKGLVLSYFLFLAMETFLYIFAPYPKHDLDTRIELPGWFVETYSYNVFSVASEYVGNVVSDDTYEKITLIVRSFLDKKRASHRPGKYEYSDEI
ncbi:CvpA family protein [Anaplasma phagocytophilum]|uniref:CvpA family protein n=2 Tax=Anaplasma phagocytophilum TaxID=948 RepID=A0A168H3J5_ANAPH|nr:CvpA family protein [Anaplasma phagocytophilum]ANC33939.1 CvpA family protein [Anaplasma phagocytophilum str. Norway variant2]KJV66894.1 colicin V production family protein [Anaplasma phagocytophilum str. ApNP]